VTFKRENIASWLPCAEFPTKRIDDLFGDRDSMSVLEAWECGIGPSEFLWVCLREGVIPRNSFYEIMGLYLNHAGMIIGSESNEEAMAAYGNAIGASLGQIESLPDDEQTSRWLQGASEVEINLGICAVWCAVAVARAAGAEKSLRSQAWDTERYWQARVAMRIAQGAENAKRNTTP
jgi:hypothetical protein